MLSILHDMEGVFKLINYLSIAISFWSSVFFFHASVMICVGDYVHSDSGLVWTMCTG